MVKDLFPSPTPLTPPHHEEEWLSWLRLLRSRRVGATTFHRLLNEHGSAQAALAALPAIAHEAGVKDYKPCSVSRARAELDSGRMAGATPIAFGSPEYPALLAQLSDAPPLLWVMGRLETLKMPMVAIVGARNASSLGTRMARKLAKELGEAGFCVVSGLARGVDTAAHIGALSSGTMAIMAGGVDVVYPAENAALAQEILQTGLRVSEQSMGLAPQARHFPQRNRLISGLTQAVIVVEAAARSGSLITARYALDQGRDVLAVPGHPFDTRAGGCNMLIRDGATLVRGARDVIAAIGNTRAQASATPGSSQAQPELPLAAPLRQTGQQHPRQQQQAQQAQREPGKNRSAATPRAHPAKPPHKAGVKREGHALQAAAQLHARILERLSPSPIAEDQLVRDLSLPPARLAPALVSLELDGKIARQPGGLVHLVPTA